MAEKKREKQEVGALSHRSWSWVVLALTEARDGLSFWRGAACRPWPSALSTMQFAMNINRDVWMAGNLPVSQYQHKKFI